MAMLCNKKVTRTQTISNATSYSIWMWKAPPMEAPTSVVAPLPRMPKQLYDILFFVIDQATSMMICKNYYRSSSVTWLLWWTIFCHKFIIELKLWWIWLLKWRKLFIIEVDIPSSDSCWSPTPPCKICIKIFPPHAWLEWPRPQLPSVPPQTLACFRPRPSIRPGHPRCGRNPTSVAKCWR